MRAVIIGASSGLGRSVAMGLGAGGHDVALLARRAERLEAAAAELGERAHAVACDVTDEAMCHAAIDTAAAALGGIDTLVYATGLGTLGMMADLTADAWTRTLATNVVGATTATRAALPHLRASSGCAIYFSSVSASMTPAWPGLGAYIASKAALDKTVDAWRVEHPEVGFTRLVVGDCAGGDGDSAIEFTAGWDHDLATDVVTRWYEQGYVSGSLLDVDELVSVIEAVATLGKSAVVPTMAVVPRVPRPEA